MFCNSCGAQWAERSKFCGQCGHALVTVPADPAVPVPKPSIISDGQVLKQSIEVAINKHPVLSIILTLVLVFGSIGLLKSLVGGTSNDRYGGLTYDSASSQCSELVKKQLRYPSSFEDVWKPGDSVFRQKFPENGLIMINFSAKNSFGMPIEGQAHCMAEDNGKVTLIGLLNEDGTGKLLP